VSDRIAYVSFKQLNTVAFIFYTQFGGTKKTYQALTDNPNDQALENWRYMK
jgi:hypothetical protein